MKISCKIMSLAALASITAQTGCREPNSPPADPVAAAPRQGDAPESHDRGQEMAGKFEPAASCNIESIDGAVFSASPSLITGPAIIRGWLGDPEGRTPTAPLLVVAGERKEVVKEITLQPRLPRPDVAKAFPGKAGLGTSGFEVAFDPQGMESRVYHFYLTYRIGEQGFLCDNGRQVEIRQ